MICSAVLSPSASHATRTCPRRLILGLAGCVACCCCCCRQQVVQRTTVVAQSAAPAAPRVVYVQGPHVNGWHQPRPPPPAVPGVAMHDVTPQLKPAEAVAYTAEA